MFSVDVWYGYNIVNLFLSVLSSWKCFLKLNIDTEMWNCDRIQLAITHNNKQNNICIKYKS